MVQQRTRLYSFEMYTAVPNPTSTSTTPSACTTACHSILSNILNKSAPTGNRTTYANSIITACNTMPTSLSSLASNASDAPAVANVLSATAFIPSEFGAGTLP